jgi:hypothetical protein
MPCVAGSWVRNGVTASATPSPSSSGRTMIAARPICPRPPVVVCVGDATKSSPPGAKRSWRALPTLAKKCAQKPIGSCRKLRSGAFDGPPGMTTMPGAVVCTEPGRSQKRSPLVIGVAVGVGADGVSVGVSELVGSTVGVLAQPPKAAATARMSSSTLTWPSPFISMAVQAESGCVPSAMFTPAIRSSMLTAPSVAQSPPHTAAPPRADRVASIDTHATASAAAVSRRTDREKLLKPSSFRCRCGLTSGNP